MRMLAQDLNHQLHKGLASAYGVFGEEPLQYQESIDEIRAKTKALGFARSAWYLSASFDSAQMLSTLKTHDLFSSKRLLEYHLPETTANALQREFLNQVIEHLPLKDCVILITRPKMDTALQNTAWFKTLESQGVVILCRSLNLQQSRIWLKARLKTAGLEGDPLCVEHLLARTEGHLLAAKQAIEKLPLYSDSKILSLEAINAVVEPSTRFKVFELLDAALSGVVSRTLHILQSLKQEGSSEPTLIVWIITQEIAKLIPLATQLQNQGFNEERLLNEAGIWKNRQALIKGFLERQNVQALHGIFLELKKVEDILKGRKLGNAWCALNALCLNIAGLGGCHG